MASLHPRTGESRRRTSILGVLAPIALAGASLAQAPVPGFSADPPLPALGVDSLTVAFFDQSTGTVTSWAWDFGDGATSTLQNPTHTFTPGTYDLTLTVSNPDGSATLTVPAAVEVEVSTFGFVGIPPSLKTLTIQQPSNLGEFVVDQEAALRLGKALFWDVQTGSDGLTACASCHYHAGADNRVTNTVAPGPDGVFDVATPNEPVAADDFPFVKFANPDTGEGLLSIVDDVRGSAGVTKRLFDGISATAVDDAIDTPDATFHVGGVNTMQVTGRDAPTTIGAAFFHRTFWDGRAQHQFNGQNIWGALDTTGPQVLERLPDGSLAPVSVLFDRSTLASQAVGPPLSDVEMSWAGRSWPDLGRKLVGRQPLASQFVDPTDPVLGSLANLAGNGLDPALTYADLIEAAFDPRWWDSAELTPDGFTQMEANFALLWGLAIQVYEQTLVPDSTPYDAFVEGDEFALSDEAKRGLEIFIGKGKCLDCHGSPVFAGGLSDEILMVGGEGEGAVERMPMAAPWTTGGLSLSTDPGPGQLPLNFDPSRKVLGIFDRNRNLVAWQRLPEIPACVPAEHRTLTMNVGDIVDPATDFGATLTIIADGACNLTVNVSLSWNELGPVGADLFFVFGGTQNLFRVIVPTPSLTAAYDNGFYNIAVTPTEADLGVGADGPFGPLSFTRRSLLGEAFPGISPVLPNERTAVDGAFKAQTLRNVELTGPYMHNGSMKSLEEVVEFYARKANFAHENRHDLPPDITGFELVGTDKADLVAFLKSLTDERVRSESEAFSHPELPLKRGHVGDALSVTDDGTGNALPKLDLLPATGAAGGPPIDTFETSL